MAIFGINHIDLHSTEPDQLREFYADLLDAEELQGFHDPLRVGAVQLAFHALEPGGVIGGVEVAFDIDARGYDETLGKAKRLGVIDGDEIRWNAAARSFYVRDPDGRRIEFSHHDPGVFWRV